MSHDANLAACTLSGQMDASQAYQHQQAGELIDCPHEDGCDGAAACRAAGHCVALPVQMLGNEPDFTRNAAHRELQRQAGEVQTLRLAMSEIVETLDAGGDHPRLVLIGRAALSLRGAL